MTKINRYQLLVKNLIRGGGFKAVNIVVALLSVPLLLNYLGNGNYGIWLTVFSFLGWVNILDIGVGNGLKIKLSKLIAVKDYECSNSYIATSYFILGIIVLFLAAILMIPVMYFEPSLYLDISSSSELEVQGMIAISLCFIALNMYLSLYKAILFSLHKSYLVEFTQVVGQCLSLGVIFFWGVGWDSKLIFVAVTLTAIPCIVSMVATFFIFFRSQNLTLSLRNVKLSLITDVISVGGRMLFIQLSLLVMLSTDNLIISNLLSSEDVVVYSVVNRYFLIFITLWYLLLGPMWPLFSDAYYNSDFKWIRTAFINIRKSYLMLSVLMTISVFLFDYIVDIWLDGKIVVQKSLVLAFFFFTLVRIFTELYSTYLNAISSLNLQMVLMGAGALFNVPLSIYFVVSLNLGLVGVIAATLVCFFPMAVLFPWSAYRTLK